MSEPNIKLVPKLRFPEFWDTGEWKKKLIEDFFDVGSSKRVLQEYWTTQGVPFYRTRELVSLSKNEPFGNEIFISEELFREISEKYGTPTDGDFLVSGVGTLGISYQVQSKDRFYFKDGNVLWFKLKDGIVSTFFKFCFEADEIQNQILRQASISTVGTYTIQNAKATKFSCPPIIDEQQKIADCLSSIDELITAQTQKITALKGHKKGLMQQLFPAEGETVPKRRFPEFQDAGDWVGKTIGQIARYENGKAHEQDISEFGQYVVVNSKFISTDGEVKKYTNHRNCLAKKGDILMVLSDVPNGRAIAKCFIVDADNKYTVNQRICKLTPTQVLSKILFYLINRNQYFLDFDDGVKQTNLKNDDVLNCPILLPEDPIEQQKIADCLSSIDELITAEIQQLASYKTHKKGLMQQLFPLADEVA